MKIRYLQIFLQFLIVISFFFKTFNYFVGNVAIPITGFEALVKNEYYIIGNVFIWIVLLGSIYHLVSQVFALIKPKLYERLDTSVTAIISIQLFFGLFIVTFLGKHLELLGIIMIVFIVFGAYIRHKYKL
ncbi:MAG: hypothetical protein Q7I99_01225 [Acholeplasmataceae bacterium]|nr:hypothetical protein [Acholeplasmataceae bacterium]